MSFSMNKSLKLILGGYAVSINVGSAGLFYYDKQQAIQHKWRVRESTLQLSGLLGGWIGGMWAMQAFKHKRSKESFKNKYYACVAGNVILIPIIAKFYKPLLSMITKQQPQITNNIPNPNQSFKKQNFSNNQNNNNFKYNKSSRKNKNNN
ncbi:hypothetical protein DLAC_04890 [Tieghemostelium lacteum]|uniref:Transmembrane protein n=1 Tax=Tieghemostelium lacteum TaxID=361077 RepID=A0A151ZJA5_TIELA|nr:hypothetical protein DLAC_04890 [Tieghemostelium lacteum]|eukprot:KYQ93995.1 hypothetical protein DLAC_04890 [Tieghemostelium lacteum]